MRPTPPNRFSTFLREMLFPRAKEESLCGPEETFSGSEEPASGPEEPAPLRCIRPDYLKKADKVALISPSYYTPVENVEKTAEVLRGWGLCPGIRVNWP